jgi:hypothetical protein
LCFDELIDQRRSSGEAHAPPLTAGGDSQAGGKMTFSGAWFTNQQDWFGAFEIAALGQSADA